MEAAAVVALHSSRFRWGRRALDTPSDGAYVFLHVHSKDAFQIPGKDKFPGTENKCYFIAAW